MRSASWGGLTYFQKAVFAGSVFVFLWSIIQALFTISDLTHGPPPYVHTSLAKDGFQHERLWETEGIYYKIFSLKKKIVLPPFWPHGAFLHMHSWRGLLDLKNDRCGHLIFYSSKAQLLSIPAINFFLEMSGEDRAPIYSAWQIPAAHLRSASTSYLNPSSLFWNSCSSNEHERDNLSITFENTFVSLCYNLCFNFFKLYFFFPLPLRDRWRNLCVWLWTTNLIGQILFIEIQ